VTHFIIHQRSYQRYTSKEFVHLLVVLMDWRQKQLLKERLRTKTYKEKPPRRDRRPPRQQLLFTRRLNEQERKWEESMIHLCTSHQLIKDHKNTALYLSTLRLDRRRLSQQHLRKLTLVYTRRPVFQRVHTLTKVNNQYYLRSWEAIEKQYYQCKRTEYLQASRTRDYFRSHHNMYVHGNSIC